ncbi:acid-sensing ion channel 1-like [Crotalus adamanteus]|uniref:Acid-sensing ion channel 1-like n=1 Tax=Crotalus adamanteus TaxID=8729 RepID=A0AAW1C7N2_CROAD
MPGPGSPEAILSFCTPAEEDQHIKGGPQVEQSFSVMSSTPNLEEFANSSTLHGISHIFHHGRCTAHNILWTTAFLASLSFLFYVYTDRVEFYFQYPHATKLEEETLHSMIFPAVTICNVNLLRFSEISGHDLYWAGEFLGFLDSSDEIVAPQKTDADVVKILNQKLQQSKGERNLPFDFEELHNRAGHQIDQMLIKCKFSNESCNANDFKTVSQCLLMGILNLGNDPQSFWGGGGTFLSLGHG